MRQDKIKNNKKQIKQDFVSRINISPIPASTYIPTLAKCSIISEEELNCQVRNGARCVLLSIDTRKREIKASKHIYPDLSLIKSKILHINLHLRSNTSLPINLRFCEAFARLLHCTKQSIELYSYVFALISIFLWG